MITLRTVGQLVAGLLLAASVAGCLDARIDVEVLSQTTARATTTQVMGADFYAMIKTNAPQPGAPAPEDEFCADGDLSENADGSATCVVVEEGPFADLRMGNDEPTIAFAAAGSGLIRVSLSTAAMQDEIGTDDNTMDAQTKAMIEAFFTGHAVTVRFSGPEIVETNMTLAPDKTSAEQVIPFLDLINGTAALPGELYAIVHVQ